MLSVKSMISLGLFVIFIVAYLFKLLILYTNNGISANVLAKGKKDRSIKTVERAVRLGTFFWGASWLSLSLFDKQISKHLIVLFRPSFTDALGLTLIFLGLSLFIIAMIVMKTSWRVGIDKHTKSVLVTDGIYKFSRNPAFVGFDIMFIGYLVTYPNILTLIITVFNLVSINLLILQEEKHLKLTFKDQYLQYINQTPRYVLFK